MTDADTPDVLLSDGVVTLRPWSLDDAGFLAEASADPAIRRYNGVLDRRGYPAPPLSLPGAQDVIDEFERRRTAFSTTGTPTGVAFVIVDGASGEPLGCSGVDDWTKADVAQFGYWLAPGARGRGYATRAVILLTRWLFELGAARAFLTIVAGNDASVAVARRAGFVHEGTMREHGAWKGARCDVLWFSALPREWLMRGKEPVDDRGSISGVEQTRSMSATSDERPWGNYTVLDDAADHKVKRIVVTPGKRLSYQTHAQRAEHWFVVRGTGTVTLDGTDIEVAAGTAVDIPTGAAHRIANGGTEDLVFIEVQHGQYFGEDDIVRLEDDFGRSDERA